MKMSKTMIMAVMALGSASFAQAEEPSNGTIEFTGTIIDTPCSIAADSINQTIPLGAISSAALKNGGTSTPIDFNIRLEQCDFTGDNAKNKVTTTFTGIPITGTDLLAINSNTASGAGVAISTFNGEKIKLGVPTTAVTLIGSDPVLQFQAYLQGQSASEKAPAPDIIPGKFSAIANFRLDYF